VSDPRVAALLDHVGLAGAGERATIHGSDPVFPCAYPLGEAVAVALAAVGSAAASAFEHRTGVNQHVDVDVRRAAAAIDAHRLQRLEGEPVPNVPWTPVVGSWPTRDGRRIELCGPFPHLIDGTIEVLGCKADRSDLAEVVRNWDAFELESALAEAGQCGVVVRSADEWAEHPQGKILAEHGPIRVTRIGDADPRPLGDAQRPLGGVRVLDLTRVLAGPVHGRLLAEQGADVLLVNNPDLVNVMDSVVETGHGKRSTALDLDNPEDVAVLRSLVGGADVFADGYRGGSLERRGFGPAALAELRPGIIAVTITCYGSEGPWRARPGFEPIAQAATGLSVGAGSLGAPGHIGHTVCDYTSGCLAALGTIAALGRRAREGGSWHVGVSLCQTASWIREFGTTCDPDAAIGLGDLGAFSTTSATAFGELWHLLPPLEMSATPPHWNRTAVPIGADRPQW
jgi:crotonobetainyl-CoA:carnitine CoA-transferase CaiB-like acyl-CoA transferase